jgi:hypothetical protein
MLKHSYVQDFVIDNFFTLNKISITNLNFNNNIENYFHISSKLNNSYLFNIKKLKINKNYIKNYYYNNFKKLYILDDEVGNLLTENLNFLRLYNLFILYILYFLKIFSILFIELYFNL